MDYETARRYPHNASLGFPQYYFAERNIPLTMSNVSRHDPRGCPVDGPMGGPRNRGNMMRDDGMMDSSPARRRIAIACARCRKRKIRCSGDPGNGTGCQNCKQAGVDVNVCQFYRVGSSEASNMIEAITLTRNFANAANHAMMPIYTAGSPLYSRSIPVNHYPQLESKAVFPPTWTIPYSEETSPVETYNLDPPAAYLSNHNSVANVYGGGYPFSQTNHKPFHTRNDAFLGNEGSVPTTYAAHGLPYIHTNLRSTAANEALSPLNMTSLRSTLPTTYPERRSQRPSYISDTAVPQRQLPIPQPSSQSSNIVDHLQGQRLRSVQTMGSGSSLPLNNPDVKPWTAESIVSDGEVGSSETTSTDLMAQATSAAPLSTPTGSDLGFLPTTTAVNGAVATSSAPQTQLNFSTSTLLEAMPAPATTTTYSNFRNYALPTSSSTESMSLVARQNSQSNLYSFSTDITSKRASAGDSNDTALVSGQHYRPLEQTRAPTTSEHLHCESVGSKNFTRQHASMSTLNRGF